MTSLLMRFHSKTRFPLACIWDPVCNRDGFYQCKLPWHPACIRDPVFRFYPKFYV